MSEPPTDEPLSASGDPEQVAAWGRVTRMMSFASGLVGGTTLYVDGGYSPLLSLLGGLVIAASVTAVLDFVGARRGLAALTGPRTRKSRFGLALLSALFFGGLGFAAVTVHDGGSLSEAALTGAALALIGFLAVYIPFF